MTTDKKPYKVEFAEGCFDEFDGTPEELAGLLAAISETLQDKTIFDDARRLTLEEEEELDEIIKNRKPRQ